MELLRSESGILINSFIATKGLVIPQGIYTVDKLQAVILGVDVNITINNVTIFYISGTGFIFSPNVEYTLSVDVPCHVMD